MSLDTGDHVLQGNLVDAHHRETLRAWSDAMGGLGREGQEKARDV